ncbi:excisionase family DNA-binding protein [Nocardia sp. NPDC049190]|uniref:excisionase family DNA-binding protein n=1 Tax=Nocardia sp. NPDC049190 TaxID=3155650 RepID=UPI0033D18CAA
MASTPSLSFLCESDREALSAPTLSVIDAGRVLGVGKTTIYEAIRSGEVPSFRVGRRVRVPSAWVRAQLCLDDVPADAVAEA